MAAKPELERWIAAGLIGRDTADAIALLESQHSNKRVGRGMEAISYLGAVLVLVGVFIIVQEFWDRFASWGQLTLAAAATAVLFG